MIGREDGGTRTSIAFGVAIVIAIGVILAATRSSGPSPPQVEIGSVADFPPGSVAEMELYVSLPRPVPGLWDGTGDIRIPIIVTNDDTEGLLALWTTDPHLGCRVSPAWRLRESERQHLTPGTAIWNPCHGESYDGAGRWLSGPSPRGLDRFAVSIVEDSVIVDVMGFEEGPPR
ncbi:MAG: ubiquinol-cytochrome c reductase iron-sulfur subunit [Acidimicrobiia bacterium]